MSATIYLLIDGIPGESTDGAHHDWIEGMSFTHSVAVSVVTSGGGGGSAGRAQESFSFTKLMDSSSLHLYETCSSGKHIKSIAIDFMRPSGDSQVRFLSAQMLDVLISGVTTSNDPQGLPMDRVSLVYNKITWASAPNLTLDQVVLRPLTPIALKVP